MKQFVAPSASLTTPDNWSDFSTYVIAARRIGGFTPTVVITQTPGIVDTDLNRQIERQLPELRKLKDFRLVRRTEVQTLPIGDVAILELSRTDPDRNLFLFQYQMYVMTSDTLYTLTATVRAEDYATRMPELIAVVQSFRPAQWSPPL